MTSYVSRFWQECERYHDLAERYQRNIEVTHPDVVTSNRLKPWFARCSKYDRTCVVYLKYRGESI